MFYPLKCHSLSFETVVGYNSASFAPSRMKECVSKMDDKTNFRGA